MEEMEDPDTKSYLDGVEKMKAVLGHDTELECIQVSASCSVEESASPNLQEEVFVLNGPTTSSHGYLPRRISKRSTRTSTLVDGLSDSRTSGNDSVEATSLTEGTNEGETYGSSSIGEFLEIQVNILDSEIPVCLENCLALNLTYQKVLNDTLEKLGALLAENRERQIQLNEELKFEKVTASEKRAFSNAPSTSKKTCRYSYFGRPYFRDTRQYAPPPNKDFYAKRKADELELAYLPWNRPWIQRDVTCLKKAVQKEALKLYIKSVTDHKEKMVAEFEKLKIESNENGLTVEEAERMQALKFAIQRSTADINRSKQSPEEVVHNVPVDQIDWMKISATDFQGHRTADACKLHWKNVVHPRYNQSSWTEEEDAYLETYGGDACGGDWEEIAENMGTNRSPFACFSRYQNKIAFKLGAKSWSAQEDHLLKTAIAAYRIGNYIPWGKIAYCLDGWSRKQVVQHWHYTLDPNIRKGRFLPEEDELIVLLLHRFGSTFARIAQYLPGRVPPQVSTHFKNYIKPELDKKWTKKEDKRLMQFVTENGTVWKELAAMFKGRKPYCIRHRYATLVSKMTGDEKDNPLTTYLTSWTEVRQMITSVLKQVYGKSAYRFEELESTDRSHLKKPKRQKQSNNSGSLLCFPDAEMHEMMRCTYAHIVGREKDVLTSDEFEERLNNLKLAIWVFRASLKVPNLNMLEDVDDSDLQFLEALVGNDGNLTQADFHDDTPATNPLVMDRDVNQPSTSNPALLPPCYVNAIGFRCLLVAQDLLKLRALVPHTEDADQDVLFAEEPASGFNTWNSSPSFPKAAEIKRPSPQEADELLRKRFKTLFVWPAILTDTGVVTPQSSDKREHSDASEQEEESNSEEPDSKRKVAGYKRKTQMYTGKFTKRRKYMKMRWNQCKAEGGANPFKKEEG